MPVKINVIVEDNLNISLQEANMLKEDGFWNKHPTSIPVRDYSQVQFEDKNYGNISGVGISMCVLSVILRNFS